MQPNGPQGYDQPGQQPPAPVPVAPAYGQPVPAVDPAAFQAALNEPAAAPAPAPAPAPATFQPAPQPAVVPEPSAEDAVGDEEFDDDEPELPPVTWSAHEYIHQEKGTMWYTIFGVVLIVSVGLTLWLQQWTFTAVLIVIAVVIVVNSKRPPRELTYSLDDDGLTIDGKLRHFTEFKSFGVIHDSGEYSVMLIPVQRFQPGVTVYFPEEQGEDIVDALGAFLPMKDLKLDMVDRVVRLLRL